MDNTHATVIALAKRIAKGHHPAVQKDLYCLVSRGMHLLIARRIGEQNADQAVQEAFDSVVASLRSGSLTPDDVLSGIRCAVQLATRVETKDDRTDQSPRDSVLEMLSARDQDVLTRVYVKGESREVLGLSRAELDKLRNRARALLRKSSAQADLLQIAS